MSLTQQERDLLDELDDLTEDERVVLDLTMNEMNATARNRRVKLATDDRQCRVEAALIRLLMDSREDGAKRAPSAPTNVEFLADLMEHSLHGPLVQLFVMDALAKYSKMVAGKTVEELEKGEKWTWMHPQAWIDVAKEVSDKMEKRLS